MKQYKYLKTGDSMAIIIGQSIVTVTNDRPEFSKIVKALKKGLYDRVDELLENGYGYVRRVGSGVVKVEGRVFSDAKTDQVLEPVISKYIMDADRNGNKELYSALIKLDRRLKKLPDNLRGQVASFLIDGKYPVTKDGCFIAYKALMYKNGNLVDFHTKSVIQNIGTKVSLPLDKVEKNPEVGCGPGLHVGSYGYVMDMYSGKSDAVFVALKVKPEDCVSRPIHESGKIRTCAYKVLGLMPDKNEFGGSFMPWVDLEIKSSVPVVLKDNSVHKLNTATPAEKRKPGRPRKEKKSIDISSLSLKQLIETALGEIGVTICQTKNKAWVKEKLAKLLVERGYEVIS